MRAPVAAAMVFVAGTVGAQPVPDLSKILDRLTDYLRRYESELSAVVGDERYRQEEIRVSTPNSFGPRLIPVRTRVLQSEIAFLRLPGEGAWFGIRDVHHVDGRAIRSEGRRLGDLLKGAGNDVLTQARTIVYESSKYNLGELRTINMPTVPLELLRPEHRHRFAFNLRGSEKVAGVPTVRVDFDEHARPTIVRSTSGSDMTSQGSVWLEPQNGRIWRIELVTRLAGENRLLATESGRLRIEFARDESIALVLPKEMIEEFYVPGGLGKGRARYSNYRRFTTGARIVP